MSATQLFYLLQWPKRMPPLVADVLAEHRLLLQHDLHELGWLASINDPAGCQAALAGAVADEAIADQALLSPKVCRAVTQAMQSLSPDDGLTALRTWRDEGQRLAAVDAAAQTAAQTAAQPKALLGGRLVVDFDSPDCLRIEAESSTLCHPPVLPDEATRALVMDKLHQAMALVDRVASSAGQMVRLATRYVRVRFATGDIGAAETDPRDIGEIRLLNPHMPSTRVVDLADSLIHESLHNLLAMYERRHGSFVGYSQSAASRPVSPWSGNPIPYNAFTHAVFIYYGLFHFYRLLYPTCVDPEQRRAVAELIGKCSRGFRLVHLDDCLRLVGQSPDWLLALYRRMGEDVRTHYPSPLAMAQRHPAPATPTRPLSDTGVPPQAPSRAPALAA